MLPQAVHSFHFDRLPVRVLTDESGDPWFNASDVCSILEFGNPRQAVETHVDPEDVQKLDTLTAGGRQRQNHVNESGLYSLIFGSTKESAKRFKRWVTSEVMPSIRKTGSYAMPPRELTRMELIQLAMDSEKARLAAEAERDHAIATKALIGSRREATAMATASAAARKARQLEQELGRGTQHATIIAVEKATGLSFGTQGFRPLKNWCKRYDVQPPKVPCPRYGKAVSWPAQAWMDVYSVDLTELFGEVEA